MCLDTVTQRDNLPKWGIGYKVVCSDKPIYYDNHKEFNIGSTYNDPQSEDFDVCYRYDHNDRRMTYPTGYHFFILLKDAKEYRDEYNRIPDYADRLRIFKIRYSRPKAIGTQCGKQIIVARRITILSEVSL